MARFAVSGTVFLCLMSMTLAVVNQPCNDEHTDCSPGECCASYPGKYDGFKGVCQAYLKHFHECDPAGPKDGHCGCGHSLMCTGFSSGYPRCNYILP